MLAILADPAHSAIRLRALAEPEGPGSAKLGVLGQLYRLGLIASTGLAQCERVRLQTLTRLLAELEAEKLIRRRTDPRDAWQSLLSLSPAGLQVLNADARQREISLAAAIAQQLAPAGQAALVKHCGLLDRLGDAVAQASHVPATSVAGRSRRAPRRVNPGKNLENA